MSGSDALFSVLQGVSVPRKQPNAALLQRREWKHAEAEQCPVFEGLLSAFKRTPRSQLPQKNRKQNGGVREPPILQGLLLGARHLE